MKALNKEITSRFYTCDAYNGICEIWKQVKNPTFVDHLFYNLLRGRDYRKGFTPITNPVKLRNGMRPNYSCNKAKFILQQVLNRTHNSEHWDDGSTFTGRVLDSGLLITPKELYKALSTVMEWNTLNPDLPEYKDILPKPELVTN